MRGILGSRVAVAGTLPPRGEGLASGAGRPRSSSSSARPPDRPRRGRTSRSRWTTASRSRRRSTSPTARRPPGGWPAIVFLHGLSGNRQQMNALVEGYGFTGGSYAILTFDARGHGESGGLVGIDGPREVADIARDPRLARRAAGRLRHEDRRLGHLLRRRRDLQLARRRRSVGGGRHGRDVDRPLLGAHAAGPREVRTRRRASSARSRPTGATRRSTPCRLRPSPGTPRPCSPWADARSSLSKLGSVTTPVFMAQGRRDFLFGIDQGVARVRAAEGPEGALRRPPRARAVDVPGGRHRLPHDEGARLVRLLPPQRPAATGRQASVYVASEKFSRAGRPPRDAAARLADVRLVPGRHDVRPQRQGRPHVRAAPHGDRDLRRADRPDVDRRERRLVAARRRAHRPHAAGQGDRRQRRRRADEARARRRSRSSSSTRRRSSRRARG